MADDGGPLRLHAVVREPLAGWARRALAPRPAPADGGGDGGGAAAGAGLAGTRRVRHGGLVAVVSSAAAAGRAPAESGDRLDRHARVVEALAGTGPVVPAPPGLEAPGEAAVRAFLERARLSLEEALDLFDGACERRLHVRPAAPGEERAGTDERSGATTAEPERAGSGRAASAELYDRLRRHALAARRLPAGAGDLLTAAFLVPVGGWPEGRVEVARWAGERPALEAELTGPWAPYDFVRVFPVAVDVAPSPPPAAERPRPTGPGDGDAP